MKVVITLLILQTSSLWACEIVSFQDQQKKIEICYDKKTNVYLSKSCKKISDCFPKGKLETIHPNQSPTFTLCYDIKGKPFFANVSNSNEPIPLCLLKNNYVDLTSLLEFSLSQK